MSSFSGAEPSLASQQRRKSLSADEISPVSGASVVIAGSVYCDDVVVTDAAVESGLPNDQVLFIMPARLWHQQLDRNLSLKLRVKCLKYFAEPTLSHFGD